MARRAPDTRSQPLEARGSRKVEGARLEPLRTVRRELRSPSGDVVVVEVPVYPPFRLRSEADGEPAAAEG